MKQKLLIGLISAFSFLLFNKSKAQVPVVDFAFTPTVACAGSSIQVNDLSSNSPTGWTYNLGGSPSTSTLQNPVVMYNTPGIHSITLVAINGVGEGIAVTKTIEVIALPQLTVTGTASVCAGGTVTQVVSGADTFTWSTGTTVDTETFSPMTTTTYSVAGTHTLTGCSNTSTLQVTINPLPALSISGNGSVCTGSSITPTLSGADTYTWNGTAVAGNTVELSPTANTSYTLEGTAALTGCTNSVIISIAVNPLPTVSITGNATVCAGSPVVQTASGADSYVWSNNQTTDAATFTPVASAEYTVTGTNTITGCSDVATVSVTTIAVPVLSLSGTNAYCLGGSASQTVTGADTYLWSTGTATDTEVFNPAVSTTYSVTGTNTLTGCSSTKTLEITVNPLPTLSVTGSAALCIGSSITNTLNGADTYTWNGVAVTSNTIELNPTANTTYTLEGTTALTGCSSSMAVSIIVNPLPTVTIAGGATVCAGSTILQTASGADNYLWSDNQATNAASFTPVATTNYTVTGTNTLTGCTDTETVSINVIAVPVLTLSGTNAYCLGGSASQTVTGGDAYVWSTGTATDTEVFSPTLTTTYSVTGTSTLTGCSATNTVQITVNPLPALAVSGNGSVCIGSATTPTLSGADSYTWNSVAIAGNTLTLNPTANTTYTLEGTIALTGCTNSISVSLAVNPLPTVSIAGNATVCAGSTVIQTASGADSYLWSDNQATEAASFAPVANTSYTVTGTNTITGCTDTESVSISVIAVPVLTLSGNNSYCFGGSASQTVTGGDTYVWSTGTVTDTEVFSPTLTTSYSVTGTSTLTGCSATRTLEIIVLPLPVLSISGNGSICIGSTITRTLNGADTYSWNSVAVTGNTVSLNPIVNTSYTLDGTNATTGCFNSTIISIAVNPLPTITIVGNATVCSTSSVVQTASGADSYLWNDNQATDAATFSPVGSTVYTVTGTNTLTGCSDVATASVTAIGLPTLVLSGTNSYCQGGSATQTVSGADTYSWSTGTAADTETFSPATTTTYSVTGTNTLTGCLNTIPVPITVNIIPTITVNSGTVCAGSIFTMIPGGANTYTYSTINPTVIPVSNTTYSVTGTSLEGCVGSNTAIASVTVNALPVVSISNATICAGTEFVIQPTGGSTFVIQGNTATVSPVVSTIYTITSISVEGCPSSNTATLDLTVNALPTLTISGTTTICAGQTTTLSVAGASTYVWNNSSTNTSITPSPAATTNYSVTGTDLNGCVNTASTQVTVNTVPTLTVTGGTICQGSTFTLSPAGANTYTYSGGSNTVSPASTTVYTITGTSSEGCVSPNAVATVSVVNAITLTVSGDLSICSGLGTTLTANGATTYTWNTGGNTAVIAPTPAVNTNYTVTGFTGPCTNTTLVTVTVNALPTLTVTSSASVICLGQTATLNVSGAASYSWSTAETVASITVTPASTAVYTVGGLDVNGCANAATITQSVNACTGIANVEAGALYVSLYPNPNNGEFNIEVMQEGVSIAVLNNLGQVVYSDKLQHGVSSIKLEDQAKGIYFVTLRLNNQSRTIKMLKN